MCYASAMSDTVEKLSTLAEGLAPAQQQVLLEIAANLACSGRFYDTMTAEQRAALEEAIGEGDRGEGVSRSALDARLDALFARHGA